MTQRPRILVIEDDAKTAENLRLYLEHAGFQVQVEADGNAGLAAARAGSPDLILLDRMLPGIDGLRICRQLRADSDVPILMLTARATEDDRVQGLELGADDYIPKPFSPREVVARVRAVLRRTPAGDADEALRFEGLEIFPQRQEVRAGGRPVALTPTEFQILVTLARAPGRVFNRAQLVERAFGPHFEGFDRTVDAHIKNLRRKIEPDRAQPSFIVTVFGVGYRFLGGRDAA